ncbi:MAG: polysaccharide deacetylase family protein [Candidatus Omnitrophota bacterium]
MQNNPVRRRLRRDYHAVRRVVTHVKNALTDPSPKLIVLTYHRILPDSGHNPLNTAVSERTFIRHVEGVARKAGIISLSDAAEQCRTGRIKRALQAVISFDDGYSDNYGTAFPLLKRKGLPAVFSVSTGYIGAGRPLWDSDVIMRIIRGNIGRIDAGGFTAARGMPESACSFAFRVFDELKSKDFTVIGKVLEFLVEKDPGYSNEEGHCMTWEQVKELSDAGMEIGSHAVTHRSLARIPFAEAEFEVNASKAEIEKRTGRRCAHFAFPFGSARDYNAGLIECVKKAGYGTCLLNIHGYNRMTDGVFALKRAIMEEDTDVRFILG